MGTTKIVSSLFFCIICATVVFSPYHYAQSTSTRPADLVNNEKVIYTLPEIGSITPDNPLFFLKQIRDGVLLALPQDTHARLKTLIQLSDKYTVYAEKLARLSKSQRAAQSFQTAMGYQTNMIDILKEELKKSNEKEDHSLIELRNTAIQSNIKQAETIRQLIDDVSASEQPVYAQLLEKNMQLRKKLQGI